MTAALLATRALRLAAGTLLLGDGIDPGCVDPLRVPRPDSLGDPPAAGRGINKDGTGAQAGGGRRIGFCGAATALGPNWLTIMTGRAQEDGVAGW